MSEVSRPQLTILIPCYNEALRIEGTVRTLVQHLRSAGPAKTEVILVDDASADNTWSLLQRFEAEYEEIRATRVFPNRGKGGALAAGAGISRGERVLFFDADLSYGLDNIERAMSRLDAGADVVIGARDLGQSEGYSALRSVMSAAFNAVVDALIQLDIPDTQCGFKAFRGEVARALFDNLTISRFGFDVELLFLVQRWNLDLERMPIQMVHRGGSTVRVVRDSLQMVRDILRVRRNARAGRYPEDLNAALAPR